MSHVCLQLGQCGNQLGHEFFSVINSDINAPNVGISVNENMRYCDASLNKWFRYNSKGKSIARAVVVDTERKVIKNIRETLKEYEYWQYEEDNCILKSSSGAANNWALGYKVKGPDIREYVVDAVRKESERCDRLESILSFGSSAGGTGSGVGSYLTEQLQEEFSNKLFFNFVVLPYRAGEVVTQNFNTLFTISKLYTCSDAIFLFENDDIHKITSQWNIENVSFPDLNKVIAYQIASVFQPYSNSQSILNSILSLIAHSDYKLLTLKSSPFTPVMNKIFESIPNWINLKRNIVKTLKEPFQIPSLKSKKSRDVLDLTGNYSRMVGNIFICRGAGADKEVRVNDDNVNLNLFYAKWVPKSARSYTFTNNRTFLNVDRFATLVTNNASVWSVMDAFISKSWDTFTHKAYVHQYAKYGVENEDFLEMFLKMERIVRNYKNL